MIAPALLPSLTFLVVVAGGPTCEFPASWTGKWFQSGLSHQGPVLVNRSTILGSLECIQKGRSNRYLVYERKFNCHKCMVIYLKHHNVIQYKESFCDPQKTNLRELCLGITGDANLYSMFRLGAEPVTCPFRGPLTFTYSKGYGECAHPVSQIDSCADDSRLLFRHQACADVSGSESYEEELLCLAMWKEGSNYYLVGKLNYSHAFSDEDRYRCFIYDKPRRHLNSTVYHVAQSADATCQGLVSPYEGSKTMRLNKTDHNGKKCKFPSWFARSPHWHTLDYGQSYYVYQRNTTLRISNGTTAPDDLEERGHTDLRLVCFKYLDHHKDHHHSHHREHRGKHHADENTVMLVVHVTVGCRSGYRCMRMARRDDHVVQTQSGELAFHPNEACSHHYWNGSAAPLVTLVAQGDESRSCGPLGKYVVPDVSQTCQGTSPTYTHVVVGCNQRNTLQLHIRCPEETVSSYQCHSQWELEGVTYVIASPQSRPSGAPRRVCFAYSDAGARNEGTLYDITLIARHDTCSPLQDEAHILINATLDGHCTQASSIASGCGGHAPPSLLLLPLVLLTTARMCPRPAS